MLFVFLLPLMLVNKDYQIFSEPACIYWCCLLGLLFMIYVIRHLLGQRPRW